MRGKKALRKKHIYIGHVPAKPFVRDKKGINRAIKMMNIRESDDELPESALKIYNKVQNYERKRESRHFMNTLTPNEKIKMKKVLKEVVDEATQNIRQIEQRARKEQRKLAKKQLKTLAPKKVPVDVINTIVKMI